MSSNIKYMNTKTGVTYIYESTSYWDKDKKQPRNKRVCIGKLDSKTGDLIPSRRILPTSTTTTDITAMAKVIGPTYLLDEIDKQFGIGKLLKKSCPMHYEQIKAVAYYLVINGGPLSHCGDWATSYFPEMANELCSQRISEILQDINIDTKQTFLKQWLNKMPENDYYCYDITSISSYSECNEYVKYGYNRDKEKLPQLNLAVVFGQKTGLPVYYNSLPGDITDVITLTNLIKTMCMVSDKKLHYIMDKGFYSKKNIDNLLDSRMKFTIAIPLSNKWLQSVIDDIYLEINDPEYYHQIGQDTMYVSSKIYPWGKERYRCYLHLYYNPYLRACDIDKFNAKLIMYKTELESGKLIKEHQEAYDTFFTISTTPKRGTKVIYNKESVRTYITRYTGFYAVLTNSIKDPIEALYVYRNKDVVEKCFDDLKNQLDMKRLRIHSSQAMEAKLFMQFIALIYTSALRKTMKDTGLIKKYTVREILQNLANITKVIYSGRYGYIITEISKSQREILEALKIVIN